MKTYYQSNRTANGFTEWKEIESLPELPAGSIRALYPIDSLTNPLGLNALYTVPGDNVRYFRRWE